MWVGMEGGRTDHGLCLSSLLLHWSQCSMTVDESCKDKRKLASPLAAPARSKTLPIGRLVRLPLVGKL